MPPQSSAFAFNIMKIIPIDSFELKTNRPKKDLIQIFNDSIDKYETILGSSGNKLFTGNVDDKGFKLHRKPFFTVSNVFYIGKFVNSQGESIIKVRVRYYYPVYAILLFWICISFLIAKGIYPFIVNEGFTFFGNTILVLIPIVFFGIGYLLFAVPFYMDLKKTKKLIKSLFNIDVNSEPAASVDR